MKNEIITLLIVFSGVCLIRCENAVQPQAVNLLVVYIGTTMLNLQEPMSTELSTDQPIVLAFSSSLDVNTVEEGILLSVSSLNIPVTFAFFDDARSVSLTPAKPLDNNTVYSIKLTNKLKGSEQQSVDTSTFFFKTKAGVLSLTSLKFDAIEQLNSALIKDVSRNLNIDITFSNAIEVTELASKIKLVGGEGVIPVQYSLLENNSKIKITTNTTLRHLERYQLHISSLIRGDRRESFAGFSKYFYTEVDSNPKFPVLTDDELLTKVQHQIFKYFYDFAHPASGMARERNTSGNLVTSGGSGFGAMALIVGMERGFITRAQGLERLDRMLSFLETCERFHGVWPHWLDGSNGKTIPFSTNDNGADLVETSFMIQGLLTMRQYLDSIQYNEKILVDRINALWERIEWSWFTRGGQNVLYWHWSPDKGWAMNMAITGYNEALITYLLAASSPTHSVDKPVYTQGWARSGAIQNRNPYYGIVLPVGYDFGGPLFFAHYSFLGLDPQGLSDQYADYWQQNVNHSLINRAYCVANPKSFVGYSSQCWGLTASDNHLGYSAHSPTNDVGVISPTAALSSFPYTPSESMQALKFFYYTLGDRLWGEYGFYDAFNLTEGWVANSYLAIDQGPVIVMIENHRTGLLWELFMSAPEIKQGLNRLGFTSTNLRSRMDSN
jgi:hypothetical protein